MMKELGGVVVKNVVISIHRIVKKKEIRIKPLEEEGTGTFLIQACLPLRPLGDYDLIR